MEGKFVILNNGVLNTYTRTEDIPMEFDNLIQFLPDFPEGPHTEEQHTEMNEYNEVFKSILRREKR